MEPIEELRIFLQAIAPGKVQDASTIAGLLASCWDEITGGDANAMRSDKFSRGIENVRWEPPNLYFEIERHGGTVLGSTYAEMQYWKVNVDEGNASCGRGRNRQINPRQASLDVKPLAQEIVELILKGEDAPQLKWSDKQSKVKVLPGRVIPNDGSAKQTLIGRRQRFRTELDNRMQEIGWVPIARYTYEKPVS